MTLETIPTLMTRYFAHAAVRRLAKINCKHALVIIAICSLTGCSVLTTPTPKLEQAEKLYQESNYEASFKSLLPIARSGNPQAQYAIGYMYYYGQGVAQDISIAKIWMRNAAKQGYDPARRALAAINNYDSTFVATTPRTHIERATTRQEPAKNTTTSNRDSVLPLP